MRPTVASFFILTPIPGTEQYDSFRKAGWITEPNLDRFDATCPTWAHPVLSPAQLDTLLYHCYVSYYGFLVKGGGLSIEEQRQAVYYRLQAARRMHPMAGGVDPLRLDAAADYAALRKATYDIEFAPLPDSLTLSDADEKLNRRVKMLRTGHGDTPAKVTVAHSIVQ